MISQLAKSVRQTLKGLFPNTLIKEEEYLNYKGQRLFFDFYIPSLNLYVEVQGEQHSRFSSHFYKDKLAFTVAKRRDQLKEEWCDLHESSLVKINYDQIPISDTALLLMISEAQNGRAD